MHGMGRVWANKFELGRDPFFEKRVLTSLARKMPKNICHSAMHPRFSVFLTFWEQLEFFLCFFLPRFWLLASFFPRMGGRFCCSSSHKELLSLLTHSKLGAVLLLLPMISYREPFHAQELGAVCVNFLSRILYCPRRTAAFLVLLLGWGIVVNSCESHFGHDRAKNDSGICFPCSSCGS